MLLLADGHRRRGLRGCRSCRLNLRRRKR
jgi:hypothetical protein